MSGLDEYQIVVAPQDAADPFSMDELIIRLAPSAGQTAEIEASVINEVLKLTNLRPTVQIVERDAIYDPLIAAKPRRILDLRQAR
jgi:phenylacetate-CoA ligase